MTKKQLLSPLHPVFSKLIILSLLFLLVISAMPLFSQSIDSPTELRTYLSKQPKNSADQPIKVKMSSVEDSMLLDIAKAIIASGRYVSLDLTGNSLRTVIFGSPKTLVSIILPNGTTTIGKSSFMACSGLESVTLPNTLTTIETLAFINSGLESVTIPGSVTTIGDSAFSGCKSLKKVTISNGVKEIGNKAFKDCTALESITIPASVTKIGSGAFENCTALTTATIQNGAIGDDAFNGCKNLTTVTIGNSVTSIGDDAFKGCVKLTSLNLGTGVNFIGENAFSGCSRLTSVTIPNSVTVIEKNAFEKCSDLKTVTIGNGVRIISWKVFSECSSLTSVTIPGSVTEINNGAFTKCTSLKTVTIPNSVTGIGANAFDGCTSLESIVIPKSVTTIGDKAFWNCTNLTSITFNGTYNKGLVSNDFDNTFWKDGRQSGTYTRPNAKNPKWTNTSPPAFPASFIGKWNRINTDYMMTFEKSIAKLTGAGNQNRVWILSSITGDTYSIVPESNPAFNPRMIIKLVNRNLDITAEEITGVDRIIDWNGRWEKQ